MIYLTLFSLLLIQWYSILVYKDVLCPAVIHNIMWMMSIFGLLYLAPGHEISFVTSFLIIMGSIAFQIGYSCIRVKSTIVKSGVLIKFKPIKYSVVLLFIPFSYVMMKFLSGGFFSTATLYETLTEGKEELQIPAVYEYVFKFIQFFSLAILVLYWRSNKKLPGLRKWIFALFIMGLICVLSVPTRNGLLFFFAPLIMIYLYTHKLSKNRIFLFLFASAIVFMAYFYYVSLNKFWYNYESGDSPLQVLGSEIADYLSGSIYALDVSIPQHELTRNGADTFRYFIAIFDSIFETNYTPDLVNDYTSGRITTNVYTFYDYYIRDFGVLYAVLMQFFCATLHAYTYKLSKNGSLINLALASMLTYPLIMQFFQDQYFSLMSLWIQALIVFSLVLKTRMFYVKDNRKTEVGMLYKYE